MIPFSRFIAENIDIVNGELVFPSDKGSGIDTRFGKSKDLKPFRKKVPGTDMESISLYQFKSATDILKALKKADFRNDQEVRQFVNRSAVYGARILRSYDIDIIVTPKSSSDLVKEFAQQIQSRTYYDFYIDSFQKTPNLNNVYIDKDDPRISDSIANSMERTLDKAKSKGSLSVKSFAPQHRKFVKGLFEIVDEKLYGKVYDKNVVIIDDVMTSGTTSKQIYDILQLHGANSVTTLTMFKATS